MFSAPTPSGENLLRALRNSFAFRLPGLTIPETRLQMPTLHMPSIVRTSRDAEMFIDGGRAPRVNGAPSAFGQLMNASVGLQSQQAFMAQQATPNSASINAFSTQPQPKGPPSSATPNSLRDDNASPQSLPQAPPASNCTTTSAERELIEVRRELALVSEQLQMLQRRASSMSNRTNDESEVPPPPSTDRRKSHFNSTAARSANSKSPSKIVGASYSEEDFEEFDGSQLTEEASTRKSRRPAPATQDTWTAVQKKSGKAANSSDANSYQAGKQSSAARGEVADSYEDDVSIDQASGFQRSTSIPSAAGSKRRNR